MTTTDVHPAALLSPLVAGVRTAVERQAGWTQTAQLVADQLRRHLPTSDVLTPEQRLGQLDEERRRGREVVDHDADVVHALNRHAPDRSPARARHPRPAGR